MTPPRCLAVLSLIARQGVLVRYPSTLKAAVEGKGIYKYVTIAGLER